jgi:hypothetical protein
VPAGNASLLSLLTQHSVGTRAGDRVSGRALRGYGPRADEKNQGQIPNAGPGRRHWPVNWRAVMRGDLTVLTRDIGMI